MLAGVAFMGFIPVTDAAAARAFYCGTLGLPLIADTPFAVVVQAGATVVRLTPVPQHVPQGFTIAGWQVDDVTAAVQGLRAAGVECTRYDGMDQDELGIWTAPGGDQVAWFTDPDGNTLSVSGREPDASSAGDPS